MKKILLIVFLFALSPVLYAQTEGASPKDTTIQISEEWMVDSDGSWVGVNKSMYKYDSRKELYWSKDGKKWNIVKAGTWQDADSKWLKLNERELYWSADGKTWELVADKKWKGHDGNWYMFDENGQLLISKDAGDKV